MDLEVLCIAYNAYFCNVPQGDVLLGIHTQYVMAMQEDEDLDWNEHEYLKMLIPWAEFVECSPAYLLEAVQALYSNILTVR